MLGKEPDNLSVEQKKPEITQGNCDPLIVTGDWIKHLRWNGSDSLHLLAVVDGLSEKPSNIADSANQTLELGMQTQRTIKALVLHIMMGLQSWIDFKE